jgi:DNA invertase Pin-like site-specific DNA recombinase
LQVVFWSLDQLSRSGRNATLRCLDQLTSCHVSWRCIADSCFDPGGPYSRSPGEIPAALARQDARRISALTKAGLDRARRAGKTLGRPRVAVDVAKVRSLQASGLGLRGVAKETGWSLSSIMRALGAAKSVECPAVANPALPDGCLFLGQVAPWEQITPIPVGRSLARARGSAP